jgi:hypothetical protein
MRKVHLKDRFKEHLAVSAVVALTLIAFGVAVPISLAQSGAAQSSLTPAPTDQPAVAPPASPADLPASVTVLNKSDVQSILGKDVRSAAGENMGRIVDVVVDRAGQVRAAVIDFGGFLGVGSRKIAVDWSALSFPPPDDKAGRVTVELSRDQVKAAPEYQEGKPVVVLSAQGKLEPFSIQ